MLYHLQVLHRPHVAVKEPIRAALRKEKKLTEFMKQKYIDRSAVLHSPPCSTHREADLCRVLVAPPSSSAPVTGHWKERREQEERDVSTIIPPLPLSQTSGGQWPPPPPTVLSDSLSPTATALFVAPSGQGKLVPSHIATP